MFKRLNETLTAYKSRDPAARSKLEILLLYPGVHAIIWHRLAHFLHRKGLKFLARVVSQLSRHCTGIEIHPGATIGRRLVIDHGMGVVIGETAEVGDDVLLYQGVTLGGTGKQKTKRHPTIGNGVLVGSGAQVLGSFTVGHNARIAANAVVLDAIPDEATAVGIPARVVRVAGRRVDDLDHANIPDPVAQELIRLRARIAALEVACPRSTAIADGEDDGML
ncbi:MAG: serine O-acetyltransferase [Oscillospiraceae bacterium]|jgi:serine O-acetyltransferase|nr:serine O-acetyltransferase [Oscillospiraceae bacterium]